MIYRTTTFPELSISKKAKKSSILDCWTSLTDEHSEYIFKKKLYIEDFRSMFKILKGLTKNIWVEESHIDRNYFKGIEQFYQDVVENSTKQIIGLNSDNPLERIICEKLIRGKNILYITWKEF